MKTGDNVIYLETKDGEIIETLQEVQSIETFEQKKADFVEMHTTSYTVIVDGVLAHCSSINDKAILRPLE